MNNHPSLEKLISLETNTPNPRQTASAIQKKATPQQTHAVLYANRSRQSWRVVLIPCEGFPNLPQALRNRYNGLPPVATAPLSRHQD